MHRIFANTSKTQTFRTRVLTDAMFTSRSTASSASSSSSAIRLVSSLCSPTYLQRTIGLHHDLYTIPRRFIVNGVFISRERVADLRGSPSSLWMVFFGSGSGFPTFERALAGFSVSFGKSSISSSPLSVCLSLCLSLCLYLSISLSLCLSVSLSLVSLSLSH